MKLRRLTAAILGATLVLTTASAALAATVPGSVYGIPVVQDRAPAAVTAKLAAKGVKDVPGDHWAGPALAALVEAGVLKPNAAGEIKPDEPIGVHKTAALFYRIMTGGTAKGTDLELAKAAEQAGLVPLVTNLDRPMERGEVAVMLGLMLGFKDSSVSDEEVALNFPFKDDVPAHLRKLMVHLHKIGVFKGHPDGTFGANEPLTAAQVAILMERVLTIVGGSN